MYLFYKIDDAQNELKVPEKFFFEKAEHDFLKMIRLFEKIELACDDFKICPMSKAESLWMIRAYCKLSETNEPLPKWLRWYFDFCFDLLLRGVPPEKALGLNNPRHRPKESEIAERDQKIYLEIFSLMQHDVTLFDAALELSEKYDLHESTIQNIYSAKKKSNEKKFTFRGFDKLYF